MQFPGASIHFFADLKSENWSRQRLRATECASELTGVKVTKKEETEEHKVLCENNFPYKLSLKAPAQAILPSNHRSMLRRKACHLSLLHPTFLSSLLQVFLRTKTMSRPHVRVYFLLPNITPFLITQSILPLRIIDWKNRTWKWSQSRYGISKTDQNLRLHVHVSRWHNFPL